MLCLVFCGEQYFNSNETLHYRIPPIFFWEVETAFMPNIVICPHNPSERKGREVTYHQKNKLTSSEDKSIVQGLQGSQQKGWELTLLSYLPAECTGVLRLAGFPEGVAGGTCIFVPIVLNCLLAGRISTVQNATPDVLCGRNFRTHIRWSMLSGIAPSSFTGHGNVNLSPKPLPMPSVPKESLLVLWHFSLLAKEHTWIV